MKGSKSTFLTVAEKCKNILASSWQGQLSTIKADAKGREDIYRSKVKYILRKGKPYIWVPEKDMHNLNIMMDERSSLAVPCPVPGQLANLLRSLKKLPARVALVGETVPLDDGKAQLATERLKDFILAEQRVTSEFTYTVSGVLSSSNPMTTSRSENLKGLLDEGEKYSVYRFNLSSCMYIDGHGHTLEVNPEDIEASKVDPLASLSAMLIDGINQSDVRRRALTLFCFRYMDANAKDAYILSVDRKGFDVVAKIPVVKDGLSEYKWKEYRFPLKEEAHDVETFCRRLVEMEEDTVKKISNYSGLQ